MSLPIITERLILRSYTYDDIPDIIEFVSHPSVARATPEIGTTESEVGKYIDLQNSYQPFEQDKCFDLAIERKQAVQVIGLLSLVRKEHEQGAIGWALGIDYRGQGYGTEAARALMTFGFDSLGLHRIYATTSSQNIGSWRVMERLRMKREGHLREAELGDGEWLDTLIYGILADEWQSA
ncbi:MAG: GNAT family N-acetyltransferase [Chloroflexi bacterium]|nr:GNAT family N-acetyltransferase [Chloroflexota bacterium]